MNRYILHIAAIALMSTTGAQAGVIISFDLPQEVSAFVDRKQTMLNAEIQKLNDQHDTGYIFDRGQFAPHLSLAYVSQDALNMEQIHNHYKELPESLGAIAKHNEIIDIGPNLEHAILTFWPGKVDVECGGAIKKNYVHVVLKMSENPALHYLATQVHDVLKKKYNINQPFSFTPHVTLGIICQKNDLPIDISQLTRNIVLQAEAGKDVPLDRIVLDSFKLTGHDGSEIEFKMQKLGEK